MRFSLGDGDDVGDVKKQSFHHGRGEDSPAPEKLATGRRIVVVVDKVPHSMSRVFPLPTRVLSFRIHLG